MILDDVIMAGRRLKSFIEKLEPKILDKLAPNALRSKDTFKTAIDDINLINIDVVIFIIRYYNTLTIAYREKLKESLTLTIELANVTDVELIVYDKLSETDKIIFEIIYTLSILESTIETK